MKLFITNVNAIMTVDETFVETSNYDKITLKIIARKEKVLKSYMPANNVLWSPSERNSRFEEFRRDNRGLIGEGDTILLLGEDGVLTEYYSGARVIPVESYPAAAKGSNYGEPSYYGISQDADSSKLYVPNTWLREINESEALSVLQQLFVDKNRDVENEIVNPLRNREELAKRRSMTESSVETMERGSETIGEVSMYH